jgi:hypothetical protein
MNGAKTRVYNTHFVKPLALIFSMIPPKSLGFRHGRWDFFVAVAVQLLQLRLRQRIQSVQYVVSVCRRQRQRIHTELLHPVPKKVHLPKLKTAVLYDKR